MSTRSFSEGGELGLHPFGPGMCPAHPVEFLVTNIFGLLGIEPSLHAPKACVLPVYYSPKIFTTQGTQPHAGVLPVYYAPFAVC